MCAPVARTNLLRPESLIGGIVTITKTRPIVGRRTPTTTTNGPEGLLKVRDILADSRACRRGKIPLLWLESEKESIAFRALLHGGVASGTLVG
ncbi:unnamed protein product [Zymoseptoria tritici ST99CH_3D7]|uniref:Uncharacterized protein n=2 Tax=Zymoseptoria tritici TaxID=1047171 RepID=A0A1X7RZL8_ZYMT9|nr:unnamed protein product [Zymoseptoria tritici ST99CH_3D7]SMR55537.1 unnamed protein product [Zymoseptoria tritici ST99CH_1E4]